MGFFHRKTRCRWILRELVKFLKEKERIIGKLKARLH